MCNAHIQAQQRSADFTSHTRHAQVFYVCLPKGILCMLAKTKPKHDMKGEGRQFSEAGYAIQRLTGTRAGQQNVGGQKRFSTRWCIRYAAA